MEYVPSITGGRLLSQQPEDAPYNTVTQNSFPNVITATQRDVSLHKFCAHCLTMTNHG